MEDCGEIIWISTGTFVMTFIAIAIIAFVLYHGHNLRMKKISDELQATQFKKELYNALIQTQENEKLRIARNLHDEIKPMLFVINNKLRVYEYNYNNNKNKVPDYADTIALVSKTREMIENTTHDLVPSFLANDGLFSTLGFYVKQVSNSSLKIDFKNFLPAESEHYFSHPQRLQLYRVVLELLHNIIKHDNPNTITVSVNTEKGNVVFLFAYNGKGTDDKTINELKEKTQGLGLKSLHGRIELLKGEIHYFSKVDTSGVRLTVPI
ncbi:MAG: hypothetical protein KF900_09480 [Bacteroidetes bacterium]|nr:hypothetical protein [Bacteroidota bacterium]